MSSREQFEEWWQDKFHNGNPPRGGWNLYREGDDYSDEELDGQWAAWKASRQALEIALPVLESQEKGGWIEWRGDVALPPVGNEVMVEVRMLGGNHMRGPAKTMRWRNFSPSSGDIIAYRVVEQERERGEEE